MPRRAAKIDRNQPEIVAALRKVGATVQHLHAVGNNCPDILVGFRGVNYLIEIKMPKGKILKGQKEFMLTWQGQTAIARSVDEALKIIEAV